MIVCYYADSLGMSRPGYVQLNERYIYLLEQWLKENVNEEVFVVNRARGAQTIDKLFDWFKEDLGYILGEKDILIIHEGVCDCAPRPIPAYLRRFISKLPAFLKDRIINLLHRNRARLLKSGFAYHLVDKQKFRRLLNEWLTIALKEFKRVYVFTIAPTNDSIEAHSPGFRKSILDYNLVIRDVVNQFSEEKIILIDIHNVILNSGLPLDALITKEDGHHLTARANQIYAAELINKEKQFLNTFA